MTALLTPYAQTLERSCFRFPAHWSVSINQVASQKNPALNSVRIQIHGLRILSPQLSALVYALFLTAATLSIIKVDLVKRLSILI